MVTPHKEVSTETFLGILYFASPRIVGQKVSVLSTLLPYLAYVFALLPWALYKRLSSCVCQSLIVELGI